MKAFEDMAKVYEPQKTEDRIYENWMSKGYFHAVVNPDKKPFTIVIPPPNITGQLHMGHALDNTLQDTIIRFSKQIVRFLQTFHVKTIVVACNTASAYALDELEREIDIPIIGVVKPGAKTASEVTGNGRIGVIATEATIGSGIYTQYIQELNKDVTIYGKACPLFVPLIEEGLWQDPVTDEITRRYLTELIDIDIDTLILGCTHYPLIRSTLGKIMGEKVTLVNPAYETARELKEMLEQRGILNDESPKLGANQYQFYVSDGAEKFKRFANSIIKYGILSAKTINIEEY